MLSYPQAWRKDQISRRTSRIISWRSSSTSAQLRMLWKRHVRRCTCIILHHLVSFCICFHVFLATDQISIPVDSEGEKAAKKTWKSAPRHYCSSGGENDGSRSTTVHHGPSFRFDKTKSHLSHLARWHVVEPGFAFVTAGGSTDVRTWIEQRQAIKETKRRMREKTKNKKISMY